jgi:hypothetical protein
MIYQLMRRDPAGKIVPVVMLVSAVFVLIWHFVGALTVRSFPLPVLLVIVGGTVAQQQGEMRFEATLPIRVRQIYTSRVLSMMALVWLPLLAAGGVIVGLRDSAQVAPLLIVAQLASIYTLVLVVLQSAGIRGFVAPRWLVVTLPFALLPFVSQRLSVFGAPGWQLWESFPAVRLQPFCWLSSAVVFSTTWRIVPKSFSLAPQSTSAQVSADGRGKAAARAWRPVLQSLFPRYGVILFVLFIQAVTFSSLIASLFVIPGFVALRQQGRWLMTLPIRPRVLLWTILSPMLIALGSGYVVGVHSPFHGSRSIVPIQIAFSQEPSGRWQGDNSKQCKMSNIRAPLDYWLPVRSGKAPLIQAPWGETFQPSTWRLSGYNAFNPYAVGCENSQRFFDWQFARATAATYGRTVSRSEYKQLDDEWFSKMVIARPRTQLVGIVVTLGFAFLLLLLTMINDWRPFRQLGRPLRHACLGLLFAFPIAMVILELNTVDIIQWVSWTLPDNLFAAVLVATVPLVLLYCGVDKLFRESEITAKVVQVAR